MRILVLDDEADYRAVIKRILERDGHEVVEADDGSSGLTAVRSRRPDLIISDIRMPEMNGDEFFEVLRSSEADLNIIPFIFLSGHVDEDEIVQRLNCGAAHCLRKPVRSKLLRAHVNSCFQTTERYSEFIARKLDIIVKSLPTSARHDFKPYRALTENVDAYVNVITTILQDMEPLSGVGTGSPSLANGNSDQEGNDGDIRQMRRAKYIRFYLDESKRRQAFVPNSGTEALTWQMIFLVADSQVAGRALYVSDLYFLAQAAKSTINNRIRSLVEEKIFVKQSNPEDGRRQSISLTRKFAVTFFAHIDDTIERVVAISDEPERH
ncbi:MAG: response regulator [Alphaproteobacteria bacterium]|nr:response regulator [Alphaproteobacteria bacterium]